MTNINYQLLGYYLLFLVGLNLSLTSNPIYNSFYLIDSVVNGQLSFIFTLKPFSSSHQIK